MSLRRVPIHRALVRPMTLLGADRGLVFAVGLLAAMLVLPAGIANGDVAMTALGAVVFFVGTALLAAVSKSDPLYPHLWMRSAMRQRHFAARGRWERPGPMLKRQP
jgi:type IV secretory pathway TrbD component